MIGMNVTDYIYLWKQWLKTLPPLQHPPPYTHIPAPIFPWIQFFWILLFLLVIGLSITMIGGIFLGNRRETR